MLELKNVKYLFFCIIISLIFPFRFYVFQKWKKIKIFHFCTDNFYIVKKNKYYFVVSENRFWCHVNHFNISPIHFAEKDGRSYFYKPFMDFFEEKLFSFNFIQFQYYNLLLTHKDFIKYHISLTYHKDHI